MSNAERWRGENRAEERSAPLIIAAHALEQASSIRRSTLPCRNDDNAARRDTGAFFFLRRRLVAE